MIHGKPVGFSGENRPWRKIAEKNNRSRFVPVITADCKLEEKYRFDVSLGPLKCPLLVFHGTKERDGYFFLEGEVVVVRLGIQK